MKLTLSILLSTPLVLTNLAAAPLVQSQVSFTSGSTGSWDVNWQGAANRTYFLQWSLDLVHWNYAPLIKFGAGIQSVTTTSTEEKYFVRLFLSQENQITTLQQAKDADFDYDGLSNIEEVQIHGTDPMNDDSDGDSLPDGWEIQNGLDPLDDGSTNPINGFDADPDNDGLSNIFEYYYSSNPHIADTDGDSLSDGDEVYIHDTSPTSQDTDSDGLTDPIELFTTHTNPYLWDTDEDTLSDGDEINLHGISPLKMDTDGDWMWDDWEIENGFNPVSAADGMLDRDSDGLANQLEFVFLDNGYDPIVANIATTFPWMGDPDDDGITTQQEFITYHTNPVQPDTDEDGLGDGWEITYTYPPIINNEIDANTSNDPLADPDADSLMNQDEEQLGTNPNNADTDGDGASDAEEEAAATNPLDPNNLPPSTAFARSSSMVGPPSPVISVNVLFGDHSYSHSEKYKVFLEPLEGDSNTQPRYRTNRKYGQTETRTFTLPKGAKYKVTLKHIGTSPKYRDEPKPDYDYTLQINSDNTDEECAVVLDDPQGILGEHYESDDYFAQGKDASLYTAQLTSKTVVTIPADRLRTKIGVGEKIDLEMKPSSLPTVTWALTGNKELSVLQTGTGITNQMEAGARVCSPVAEATINGTVVKLSFEVVEPNGIVMRQQPGTGIEHTMGIPSVGFTGNPYIVPNDVSFASPNVEVREEGCMAMASGYYAYANGRPHTVGLWRKVILGDSTNPSKVDTSDRIYSGNDGSATPSIGSFEWVIPISFRVQAGGAKQFTTITHHQECDFFGTVTITKNIGPFSAALNDPTTP